MGKLEPVKHWLLVSAYLIALLLPLWHLSEGIDAAWKLGERWLSEGPGPWSDPVVDQYGNEYRIRYAGERGRTASETKAELGLKVRGTLAPEQQKKLSEYPVTTSVELLDCSAGACSSTANITISSGGTAEDLDGWPNAKDCPFDQAKGARVCK